MKSSTLRRSNLSKEKMAMLEELARNKKKPNREAAPGVYVRNNKEKELDVLWQNFRVNQKDEKFRGIYFITGFIAGAIVTLAAVALLGFSVRNGDTPDFQMPAKPKAENAKLTFIPSDKAAPAENEASATVAGQAKGSEAYTVKTGDTLEGIIIRFYGKYDLSKVQKIKVANKLANPNSLQIGQKLIIPMD